MSRARPLSDGTTAVGLFNRRRYQIDAPPRPKKGEPEPKKVWKLRDGGTGKATEYDSEEQAVAALNKTAETIEITADWSERHLTGTQPARDLWRQLDLPAADGKVSAKVSLHGVVLLKIGKAK